MPLGIGGAGNPFAANGMRDPFFNQGQYRQDPAFDWAQTPVIGGPSGYLEQNPDVIWSRYLAQRYGIGLGDTSPRAQYGQQLYKPAWAGFQAALADDPTLTFQRYTQGLGLDLDRMFRNLAPQQRGENQARFAGPSRWLADL